MNKMKKISIITIILYMLFITTTFAATAKITVSAARLREEANTDSKVLTKIYEGEKVEILEKSGDWYKVKYGNKVGYLKNNLLEESNSVNSENTQNSNSNSIGKNENKQNTNSVENTTNNNVNNKNNTNDNTNSINNNTDNNINNTNTDPSKVVVKAQTKLKYQPSMTSNTIMQFDQGKELSKNAELGNWVQVSDGSVSGWIIKNKIMTATEIANLENSQKSEENETKEVENKENSSNDNEVKEVNKDIAKDKENSKDNNEKNTNQQSQINTNKKGKVNVETAKVRKTADKTSKVVGFLDYDDEITILAEEGEWYKFTEKDVQGYVHKTLITLLDENKVSSRGTNEERESEKTESKPNNTQVEEVSNNNVNTNNNVSTNRGQEVVNLAKKYLGYKYVVGGKNPETGFDCSGFTRYIYLQFGYSLGSTAAGQNNLGTEVSRENLRPGDLILFYDEGKTKIGHTGIYISNGDFVHSANPTRGVVIDNINTNSYYNERYIVAKRIVE